MFLEGFGKYNVDWYLEFPIGCYLSSLIRSGSYLFDHERLGKEQLRPHQTVRIRGQGLEGQPVDIKQQIMLQVEIWRIVQGAPRSQGPSLRTQVRLQLQPQG